MVKPQKKKSEKYKGWIGHESWLEKPFNVTTPLGQQFGLLYKTKKDAMLAGWSRPRRVEITLKVLP